jgi:hypothetical protein
MFCFGNLRTRKIGLFLEKTISGFSGRSSLVLELSRTFRTFPNPGFMDIFQIPIQSFFGSIGILA